MMVDKQKTVISNDGTVLSRKLTDIGSGLHAERVEAYPPVKLMTDNDGATSRMRVDPGATMFFKGRQYRSFRRLNQSSGSTLVIKAVVPVNTILTGFKIDLKSGSLEVVTLIGGTEGGSFSEVLPIFACNGMTEVPNPQSAQVALTAGGTHAGGVERDVFYVQVSAQGNQASIVGAGQDDIRAVPPSTFYFKLIATGAEAAVGALHMRWEEQF